MEKIDFDKIRKMPPERKVKALKELQEKLGELIKERTEEIEESKREIANAQEFLKEAEEELRVLEEMQAEAPMLKPVRVEKLFEREEQKPKEKELEAIAAEAQRTPTSAEREAYVNFLAQRASIADIYKSINRVREEIQHSGIISSYQQEKLEQFREALTQKEEAIRTGEYAAGKKAEHLLTAAERAIMYATGERREKPYTGR